MYDASDEEDASRVADEASQTSVSDAVDEDVIERHMS